jgi:hypothetical protein
LLFEILNFGKNQDVIIDKIECRLYAPTAYGKGIVEFPLPVCPTVRHQ